MIGIVGSHSNAIRVGDLLKSDGIPVHIISTPRQHAKNGCSYSVQFGLSYFERVRTICQNNSIKIDFV
jgi:hypothetical protein